MVLTTTLNIILDEFKGLSICGAILFLHLF